jgi:hypothetical protein
LLVSYPAGFFGYKPFWRVMPGFVLGVLNLVLTKSVLARQEDLSAPPHAKQAQNLKKVILIVSQPRPVQSSDRPCAVLCCVVWCCTVLCCVVLCYHVM